MRDGVSSRVPRGGLLAARSVGISTGAALLLHSSGTCGTLGMYNNITLAMKETSHGKDLSNLCSDFRL